MLALKPSLTGRFPHSCNVPFSFAWHRLSHWTTLDLIKYLVSVRPTLCEIKELQQAPAFIREVTTGQHTSRDGTLKVVPRVKASDLYVPLDVFRNLGLPVIDWWGEGGKHEWRVDSEEGMSDMV